MESGFAGTFLSIKLLTGPIDTLTVGTIYLPIVKLGLNYLLGGTIIDELDFGLKLAIFISNLSLTKASLILYFLIIDP